MNRENKRKQYEKGYYQVNPCSDSFVCKVCGASDCGGIMEPVAVWVRKGGEWAIIHRCRRCGVLHSNRVAADDNPMLLMSIALKPLAQPTVPLERLEELTDQMGYSGTIR